MQLFGLVNTMLAHDRATAERDLSIARYAVIPLSPNSGEHYASEAVGRRNLQHRSVEYNSDLCIPGAAAR